MRYLERCSNRNFRQQWEVLAGAKARILEFVWSPQINVGVKLAAIKFLQRVVLVQTRGISDPRVSLSTSALLVLICSTNRLQLQSRNDPNLSMCPADHPFIPVQALEDEGKQLLDYITSVLFSSE